jgi:hypothetical protein
LSGSERVVAQHWCDTPEAFFGTDHDSCFSLHWQYIICGVPVYQRAFGSCSALPPTLIGTRCLSYGHYITLCHGNLLEMTNSSMKSICHFNEKICTSGHV